MKILLVPLVVVTFAAGFALGRAEVPAPPKAPAPAAPPPAAPAIPADAPVSGELVTLRETARRQEERILDLECRLQEKAAPAAKPDPLAMAGELWGLMKDMKKKPKGEAQLKALKLLGDLKPGHAAFFIAKFREAEDVESRQLALYLTSLSGGPEAGDFAAALLGDAGLDAGTRRELLRQLRGSGDTGAHRLAWTEALGQAGELLAKSASGDERGAAAGILGLGPRDAVTESRLRSMADDADGQVAAAAVYALSRHGSPDTLAWLKVFRQRSDMTDWLRAHVDRAIAGLEKE